MDYVIAKWSEYFFIFFISTILVIGIFFYIDTDRYEKIDTITEEFTLNVRKEGYLSKAMYEKYMKNISVMPYKVLFFHVIYNKDENGNIVRTIKTEKNILEDIYYSGDEIYKMEKGDDFIVVVGELQPAIHKKLIELFTFVGQRPIVITKKGGMIFNESY